MDRAIASLAQDFHKLVLRARSGNPLTVKFGEHTHRFRVLWFTLEPAQQNEERPELVSPFDGAHRTLEKTHEGNPDSLDLKKFTAVG